MGLHTYLNRISGIEMLFSSEEKQKLSDRNWQSYNHVMKNVWSESEYPDVAAWLTKNEKHIEVVRAASRRPRYYHPLIRDKEERSKAHLSIEFPQTQSSREFVRTLAIQANFHVGRGEYKLAQDNILTIRRLEKLISQGATVVEQLIGITNVGVAQNLEYQLALSGKFPPTQLIDYRDKMVALTYSPKITPRISEFERMLHLDAVQLVMTDGLKTLDELFGSKSLGKLPKPIQQLIAESTDWTEVMKIGNRFDDEFSKAAKTGSWVQQQAALSRWENSLNALDPESREWKFSFVFENEKLRGIALGRLLNGDDPTRGFESFVSTEANENKSLTAFFVNSSGHSKLADHGLFKVVSASNGPVFRGVRSCGFHF